MAFFSTINGCTKIYSKALDTTTSVALRFVIFPSIRNCGCLGDEVRCVIFISLRNIFCISLRMYNTSSFFFPFQSINKTLHQLKKSYQLAVVSNKHQEAVSEIIDYYFKGMFDVVIGERPGIPKKPDPAPLNLAIKELRLNKHEVLFIGDSEVDIQTAKHADVKVVGVSWGFRDYTELKHEKPDYLILKVDQIQKNYTRGIIYVTYKTRKHF